MARHKKGETHTDVKIIRNISVFSMDRPRKS